MKKLAPIPFLLAPPPTPDTALPETRAGSSQSAAEGGGRASASVPRAPPGESVPKRARLLGTQRYYLPLLLGTQENNTDSNGTVKKQRGAGPGGSGTTPACSAVPGVPLIPASPGARRKAPSKADLCSQSAEDLNGEAPATARRVPRSPARTSPGLAPRRPRKREDRAAAEAREVAAASGVAVRRRALRMRRRRPEVTSPKSVLVPSHLSSRRRGCGSLVDTPLRRVLLGDPALRPLALRSATPNSPRACPFPPVLSLSRAGPGRAGPPGRGP
ncbi:charged multivesicular body protein 2b isoform X1 [Microcebus murinus]|uniref:charged multivesicular body protein 2b isoform X1 n=1 Tax=Microcebus murinus TaxID=30608 RepID=UPI003F6B4727